MCVCVCVCVCINEAVVNNKAAMRNKYMEGGREGGRDVCTSERD